VTADHGTEAEVVERLARAAAGPQAMTGVSPDQLIVVREQEATGADHVRVLDLEQYRSEPARRRGEVQLDEPASFEAYVNEFKADGICRLYADLRGAQLVAVFNDDNPVGGSDGRGAWRDHRATLAVQPTPEWMAWLAHDKQLVGQVEFAEFLEEHLPEISEPPSADMLEIVRSFTATNNVVFRSGINLTSGETQFAYDEQLEAKAGTKKQLTVPTTFTLALVIYEGTDPVAVSARLRWRLRDGNLRIGFLLDDAQRMEREAFRSQVANASAATGLEALYGRAARARS
jgi:uncharacterized protein YfdQ (DUF2303 family)